MVEESKIQRTARIARRIKDQGGACYAVVGTANGHVIDPWLFTEYLDAQAKKAELEFAAEDKKVPNAHIQVFRVTITPPGVEPPGAPRLARET